MNTRRSKVQCIVSIAVGFLLIFSQLAFCMESSISILGDVVGNGKAEMKAAFNKWISVSGKSYPVIDGAHLRSGDGTMSLIFRDAARMEVGKNSAVIVTGSRGSYAISMDNGKIAFSVPQGISFSVTTPTSTIQTQSTPHMIQKASLTSQDNAIRGVVSYDGKGTKVMAVSGTLTVRSGIGVGIQTVAEGNAIYIEGKDNRNIKTVQLAVEEGGPDLLPPAIGTAIVVGAAVGVSGTYHVSGSE